ncbi:2Fe-2S iron-sulfur cluster-binding protein [Rhodospirillum sp. A1_3_36]|uniref:2Fe-2S iron-sulfur cluster-binding protein n=1 Tax=Rhodospirillum sp. A1_3_36 TaxID=3391666 RepID=UPI0039A56053
MTAVTFLLHDGSQKTVDIGDGMSVMQGAILNDIKGIDGDCGGSCSCATCHVYLETPDMAGLPPLSEGEDGLLEGVAAERLPTSRLACQLTVSPALAGLVVRVPDRQA